MHIESINVSTIPLILAMIAFTLITVGVYANGNQRSSPPPDRFLLEGAAPPPDDGLRLNPEDIGNPAAFRLAMEFMGEGMEPGILQAHGLNWRANQTYMFFMGVTGDGFRFGDALYRFPNSREWERVVREAMAAAGHDYTLLFDPITAERLHYTGQRYSNADELGKTIADHLHAARKPVVLLETGGGWPDWRLIVGCQDAGATLLGFGGVYDGSNYPAGHAKNPLREYKTADLMHAGNGSGPFVVLIGEKHAAAPREEIYRRGLEWGLEILKTSDINNTPAGFRAYDAWAESLADDAKFANASEEEKKKLFEHHRVLSSDLAERRAFCAQFLKQAQGALPGMKDELEEVITCFNAEHDMVWEMWGLTGGFGYPESHVKLADPEIRRQIREIIARMKARDVEAADHMDMALKGGEE